MLAVTGASGRLGRLIIKHITETVPAQQVVALVRCPDDVTDYPPQGITVRQADYNQPASLQPALQNVKTLLLISSNEFGQRTAQHKAVIDAAKQAGVQHLIYTSILHADKSPNLLAVEHRETEALIKQNGLTYTLLRNPWYSENLLQNIEPALAIGFVRGASGDAKLSTACCDDLALATARILANPSAHKNVTYEFCGDQAYTLAEYTQTLSQLAGKPIEYENFSGEEFQAYLEKVRFPPDQAKLLTDAQVNAHNGWLYSESTQLHELLGRPTVTIAQSIEAALSQLRDPKEIGRKKFS